MTGTAVTGAVGLYVHIPFCHARCGYCDFATFTGQEQSVDRYLNALAAEMKSHAPKSLQTIFIGGGTPTVLSPAQINTLFDSIRSSFDVAQLVEATIEANPESATRDVLNAYLRNGINRISFGLQTTDDALLKKIDRLHTFDEFKTRYTLARELGFENINIDLIYGLPGQTLGDWEATVKTVLALKPEHISAYALKVEEGTSFSRDNVEAEPDLQADMYLSASRLLMAAGYEHYEISNFARPGFRSQHNLLYWKNEATIGVGLSAASHVGRRRWKNVRGLLDYMQAIQEGKTSQSENIELSENDQFRENVMLNLRLSEGVPVSVIEQTKIPVIAQFVKEGLATLENNFFRLTPRGWLVSNQLFQYLV
jgi:oxygen-independent coproporphyrinogen-3 oxidase